MSVVFVLALVCSIHVNAEAFVNGASSSGGLAATSAAVAGVTAVAGQGQRRRRHERAQRTWQRWMLNQPILPVNTTRLLLRRGENRYGSVNNSTIPEAKDVAAELGVEPPDEGVSAAGWQRAYTIQKYATPVLHWWDRYKPPNSSLNLYCIWWKALSGNDVRSPVFDEGLSYDLLPRFTRWFVRRPHFFPRLHHANVEIRTAFLDRAVTRCAMEQREKNGNVKVRLVSLGAGYDVRCVKLKERGVIDQAYELDLPEVVEAKRKILESKRFQRRRPHTVKSNVLPMVFPVDLNDLAAVRSTLLEMLQSSDEEEWHTIFLFEAVMIYLNEGVPRSLLHLCREVLEESNAARGVASAGSDTIGASLCFADRLEHVLGGDYDSADRELSAAGWSLVEWLPKPGLARHMGRCEAVTR